MKKIYVVVVSCLISSTMFGMEIKGKLRKKKSFEPEKEVRVPSTYSSSEEDLDYIVASEFSREDQSRIIASIDKDILTRGVKKYVKKHHPGCTPAEEVMYIQKIKEDAVKARVTRSILSYVRENILECHCSSGDATDMPVAINDAFRWQSVIDKINLGSLVFDGNGRLVPADKIKLDNK